MRRKIVSSPRKQRGAFGVFGALTLLIALLFMGLSIDTGRLWLEKRNVQRAADMAAMASARFTGCGSSAAQALNAAKTTAKENGIDPALVTFQNVKRGVIAFDKDGKTVFTAKDTDATNATQVELQKTVPASILLGGFFNNSTLTLKAQAVAQGGPPIATYSVGSVFGVSSEGAKQISNLFKGILGGTSPTLDTAAINALVNSTVTLQALQQAYIDIHGTPITLDAFLKKSMTVSEFLDLIAKASPTVANQQAFKDLASAAKSYPGTVLVGQILNIQSPPASGVSSANISVFDLINAGINVGAISQGGLINLNLGVSYLGGVSMNLISPPIIAIGPAGKDSAGNWCSQAQSSQMTLKVVIAPFNGKLLNMALRLDALSTIGHMDSLNVAPGNINGSVSTQSTALTLMLTNSDDVNNDLYKGPFNPAYVLGLDLFGFKIKLLEIGLKLPVGAAESKSTTFTVASKFDLPKSPDLGAGSVGASLAGLLGEGTNFTVKVLGIGGSITFLDDLVKLVMAPLGTALDGLLEALGIKTGSVRIQVLDVNASPPVLRQ